MNNIPTELLRTLIAVVDCRSFTKAAHNLGVTQPAVSAQIKRLQTQLGGDLLDRNSPGVVLTRKGVAVVNSARRLLSINDQIVNLASSIPATTLVRIGVPGDFVGPGLPWVLAEFHKRRPDVRFHVRSSGVGDLRDSLRQGDIDIAVGISTGSPRAEARYHWNEELVWLRSKATELIPGEPVPLVAYMEDALTVHLAEAALAEAGRECRLVFTASSLLTLTAAVDAGLGLLVRTRSRSPQTGLIIWDDAPLPKLPDVHCGIYLREGGDRDALEDIATAICRLMRPDHQALPRDLAPDFAKVSAAS